MHGRSARVSSQHVHTQSRRTLLVLVVLALIILEGDGLELLEDLLPKLRVGCDVYAEQRLHDERVLRRLHTRGRGRGINAQSARKTDEALEERRPGRWARTLF